MDNSIQRLCFLRYNFVSSALLAVSCLFHGLPAWSVADSNAIRIADEKLNSVNASDTPAEQASTPVGECIKRPTSATFIAWDSDPGVRGNIEDHPPDRIVTLAANGQDQLDDSADFFAALEAIAQGGILEVPAGTYYLSSPIELRAGNQLIRGAGSDKTHLVFTQSLPYGIAITGQYPKMPTTIIQGEYGSKRLRVETLQDNVVGKYGVVTNAGSLHSQVVSIIGQTTLTGSTELILSMPLNSAFVAGANVQFFDANEFSGVESLSVDVNSAATYINDMFYLRSAAHVWLRNVESRRARQAHVFTRQTYGCEITSSTFLNATGHGDGKQGYGIDLANSTTGCLVENNTLGYLRHSILLNASANGNVIAFNHSFSPRHTNFFEGGPGDVSFHGFSYANLVEGNVVERIHIGDSGPVGEGNLVHRNCLTSGPMTVGNSPDAVQSLYTNAMYGTDVLLQATIMPPVLPEAPLPRPYLQTGASLFDDDGFAISASALEPSLKNNWYRGRQSSVTFETPDSYYGSLFSPLLKLPATGGWIADCRIPAMVKAQGL
ncbi:MAG: hypothetical protein AB8B87_25165 [Granulosicoccus sp.]